MSKPPGATEDQVQAAFIEWVRLNYHSIPALKLGFHPANGGKRNIITAVKLKRLGVIPGVPDFMLPVPRNGFTGCAIEFKRPHPPGKLTQDQKDYISGLREQGWFVEVCYSLEEAVFVIKQYFRSIPPASR